MLIETATEPQPGSNLKGEAAGAAWTFLLDRMEMDSVLCLGRPSHAARATLERMAGRITLAEPTELPGMAGEKFDLVYVTPSARAALDDPGVVASLARTIHSDGRLYIEDRKRGSLARSIVDAGLGRIDAFWLTPADGEARSAAPFDDEQIRDFFVTNRISVPSLPRPLRTLERLFPVAASRNRKGLLAGRMEGEPGSVVRVPAYLQRMSAAEGFDLSTHRLGLSARGRYNSRKVIFYVFGAQANRPELIVKATRHPAHNGRLANEEMMLRHVDKHGVVGPGTVPRVLFAGEHGGLRFVAESVIEGSLLTSSAHAIGAEAAYAWLTDLSAASARRDAPAQAAIAAVIEETGSSVERLYSLSPSDRDGLRRAIHSLLQNVHRLPMVLMHGDAATWNARLLPDGRIAFMDWEAAAFEGMPLWDIFYFARSHILWGARLRELARRPPAMARALRADPRLMNAIDMYRDRLNIPTELVAPLFTLCWAHRAVREVTRLKPGDLHESHYLGLFRQSLTARPAGWSDPSRTNGASAL